MIKVIIADDEKRIVEMIRQLVDWKALGFEIIDVAYNGPDTFSLIETQQPDIVIADVRMPGYDGIELIRRCHDAEYYPSFIIVSGYRFFEYAHNALRYGVEHYLLKPLDRQELVRALEAIKQKHCSEQLRQQREKNILNFLDEEKKALNRNFIHNCISDHLLPASTEETNREFATAFECGNGIVFTALYVRLYSVTHVQMNLEPIWDSILEDFSEYLDSICIEHVEADWGAGLVSIICCKVDATQALYKSIERMHHAISQRTDKFAHFDLTTGVGIETSNFNDIPTAVCTALTAASYSLDIKTPSVLRYDAYSFSKVPISKIVTPEVERLFLDAVLSNEVENIRKYYNCCIERINSIQNRCPSMIYDFMLFIRNCISKYIDASDLDRTEFKAKFAKLNNALNHRCTAAELIEAVMLIVLEISTAISHQRRLEYSRPIHVARKYIDQHYMEQMSLDELADLVHLSSSYLSTVFKDETGIGFSDYLINCRINAAKEFLRSTDMNLSQIAEKVGYLDSKHFGKLFRKVTGIKATDFRKLYS